MVVGNPTGIGSRLSSTSGLMIINQPVILNLCQMGQRDGYTDHKRAGTE